MSTPRFEAKYSSSIMSGRFEGKLPAPNDSMTIPSMGGDKNALTTCARIPGNSRKRPTFSHISSCTLNGSIVVFGNTASQATSMSVPSFANGGKFGEANASRSDALIF